MKRAEYTGYALDTLSDDDTTELRVWIPELFPFVENDPTVEVTDTISLKNKALNGISTINVNVVTSVPTEYYGNSNISRPNIHVGEQVKLYMYADNNKFYWDVMGRDDGLRSTEHFKVRIASKPDQLTELTDDNSYYIEMDSRPEGRFVRVFTGQGNGEKVGYDLLINIDDSTFHIKDTEGNIWQLESLKQHWMIKNKNGDVIDISPGLIESSTDVFKINATNKFEVNTPLFQGNIGHTKFTGSFHVVGAQTNDSTITASGEIKSGSVTLTKHTHTTSHPGHGSGISAPGKG